MKIYFISFFAVIQIQKHIKSQLDVLNNVKNA